MKDKCYPECPSYKPPKKMTKPKTPTLASLRTLAKKKGCRVNEGAVGGTWLDIRKIENAYTFLDLYHSKPDEPTREQALAMIHAALEVLPDVRGKR